ncbi:hypothetical protein GCM10014713_16940 [Streptomyces purpureus]|uniref:Uncharacterized protein n=1 Tax=Streptomyces purpureus TaxID=1951 RepID=A0A918H0Z2_9ACTN|nr:hypothetical protein GCM10014713_16940 [Streptomyces purpureus]
MAGALTFLAALLPATTATADETNRDSRNGPVVALIHAGQIDDPAEDVLEHANILGTTHVSG